MMQPPNYFDATLEPVTTDELIQQRVSALIGRALSRQLWHLFLDENNVQSPLLLPLEGMPFRPRNAKMPDSSRFLRAVMDEVGASCIIFVWERQQDAALTDRDREWFRYLHDACDTAGIRLRAILLSHRRGVRWVAQDDYRFENPWSRRPDSADD